ncbi:DNA cytosine methyltransferase [Komagataeibacter xylinus]|uniref:DNA cytosine methyltransferase n=1 Tax=Komagataeibacter xylinus TaxID=28448 RepID=UPI00280BC1A8|nr:DNA cytosine methyltransferase [Komagataeibacter xylinus]
MIFAATLCSGIGAPEMAMPGWCWRYCAEIEPFPLRMLARRFPASINLGDLLTEDFSARACALGPIDVLVAGTPCQDFSVAGRRTGLEGARGNLTLRAIQIYEEHCDAARSAGRGEPLYVWENVPGILSDKTNAFGCLLGALAGCETALVPPARQRWTRAGLVAGPRRAIAWRVLDAQYFGLAQRRERVFVVAGALDGPDPATILFEPESVPGNPAPRRCEGENIAPTIARGSPGGCVYGLDADTVESLQAEIAPCLQGQPNRSYRADTEMFIPLAYGGNNCSGPLDVAPALNAHGGPVGRLDFESEAFICATLDASYGRLQGCAGQDASHGHSHLVPMAFDCTASGQNGFGVGEIASTMRSMGRVGSNSSGGGHLAVMAPVSVAPHGRDGGNQIEMGDDVAHALSASQGGSDKPHLLTSAVRRLMPIECERLQGFPDHHTDVPNGNRPAADGPRYKALGNSMPVPVLRWLLRRVEEEIIARKETA